jgi:hypothetical protein
LRGDGCDQHCVASQAVWPAEILPRGTPEMPANGGLLRIGGRSLGSGFGRFRLGLADSLRRIFEIFPFSGDSDRRPGSIGTAGPAAQSYLRRSIDLNRVLRVLIVRCRPNCRAVVQPTREIVPNKHGWTAIASRIDRNHHPRYAKRIEQVQRELREIYVLAKD